MSDIPFQFCFYNYRRFYSPVRFDCAVDASERNPLATLGAEDTDPNRNVMRDSKGQKPRLPTVLPVTPEEVQIGMGNTATTINTVGGRTFTHAIGLDLEKISFSGFFPHGADGSKGGIYTPTFNPVTMGTPGVLADKFRRAMIANQPLIFGVLPVLSGRSSPVVVPLEYTITNFTRTVKHGHGSDIFYEMELQRWWPQQLRVGTARPSNSAPPSNNGTWPNYAKYITVEGDTLSKIAYKQFRDHSRWREIYELNWSRLEPPPIPAPGVSKLYVPIPRSEWTKLSKLRPGVTLLIPKK